MYTISFIDTIKLLDMTIKLHNNQISLTDGEMITLRNIYRQMSDSEQEFVLDKYGEQLSFLVNYEGARKRKK